MNSIISERSQYLLGFWSLRIAKGFIFPTE